MNEAGRKQIFLSPVEIDLLQCSLKHWVAEISNSSANRAYVMTGNFSLRRIEETQNRLQSLIKNPKKAST